MLDRVRILAVHHDSGLNGAALLFQSILEGLAKGHGAAVSQTFPREGPLVARAKELGPVQVGDVRRKGRRRGFFDWRRGGEAQSGRAAYDLIFANTIASLPIVEWMMADDAGLAALPLVVYVHESHFLLRSGDRWATERMLRRARLIFAVSSSVRQTLEKVIQPSARIAVVSGFLLEHSGGGDAIEPPVVKAAVRSGAKIIGGMGTITSYKGTDLFIAVAIRIRQLLPTQQLRFIWLGQELDPDLRRLLEHDIERAGLGDVVALPGRTADPISFFESLSLFLLPSREDSWPLVMLEAAAAGVPIVCFQRSGGAEEFVANGGGAAVPYLDVEAMAQAAVRYLSEPDLLARDSGIARQIARAVTPEHQIGQIASEIAEMLQSPRPRGALDGVHPVVEDRLPSNAPRPVTHERGAAPSGAESVRLLAFYLPQFHPIPENDRWWGTGFTEWTNVAKARPLFRGHYQPHIPADLGFCDLRVPEVREAQAALAREYGISGFCYYHYWFNGKRLLNRPFDEVLRSGRPDFPFCLCWANENWTRRWDGYDQEILIGQNHSLGDDREHIRHLFSAFEDQRYIRVHGKPLFLVYRTEILPDPERTADVWREAARAAGIGDLYLVRVESHSKHPDPRRIGFDAAVEFAPDLTVMPFPKLHRETWGLQARVENQLRKLRVLPQAYFDHNVYSYEDLVTRSLAKPAPPYTWFRCVTPSWDNSARRAKKAIIIHNSKPDLYERWLREMIQTTVHTFDGDERLLFVNAWNEWAEGNHLEPDQRWGRAYLEATRRAVMNGVQPPRDASRETVAL